MDSIMTLLWQCQHNDSKIRSTSKRLKNVSEKNYSMNVDILATWTAIAWIKLNCDAKLFFYHTHENEVNNILVYTRIFIMSAAIISRKIMFIVYVLLFQYLAGLKWLYIDITRFLNTPMPAMTMSFNLVLKHYFDISYTKYQKRLARNHRITEN